MFYVPQDSSFKMGATPAKISDICQHRCVLTVGGWGQERGGGGGGGGEGGGQEEEEEESEINTEQKMRFIIVITSKDKTSDIGTRPNYLRRGLQIVTLLIIQSSHFSQPAPLLPNPVPLPSDPAPKAKATRVVLENNRSNGNSTFLP